MRYFFTSLGAIFTAVLPAAAFAQGYHLQDSGWNCFGFVYCTPGSPPPADVVTIIAMTVINGVLISIELVAVIAFLYGAIRMVASQGQEGKEAGKKALIWASVGLAAALLTQFIIEFVVDYLYVLGTL